jgi:hypothetical protein
VCIDFPLAAVLEASAVQSERLLYTRFGPERSQTIFEVIDISLSTYTSDFVEAAELLLENEQLRLHGMFGIQQQAGPP